MKNWELAPTNPAAFEKANIPFCLTASDLRDTKLGPLLIAGGRLLPARLDNSQARYADLRGSDLRRARLSGCDLSYTNLSDADMRDTETQGAEFAGAKLPMRFAQALAATA